MKAHTWLNRGLSVAVAMLALAAMDAGARDRVQSSLVSTGVVPAAKGSARLIVQKASDGRFEVKVKKLPRNAAFDVLVDSVKVGSLQTNGGGNGQLRFRTKPKGHDVALGFDPRGGLVEVRDESGDDVLTGGVPDSNPGDPGDVVCCVPDDHGAECEDRTPDECAAQGGTVSTATSCLPNPCGDSAGGALVACCSPEDDGTPECELRTATACLAHGGVSVAATVCDPNPCTGTFPSTDIQCCLPHGGDEGEVECEDRTPDECTAQGGVNMGAGSCHPDPCTGATDPTGSGDGGDDGGSHGGGNGDSGSGHGNGGNGGNGGGSSDD